MDTVEVKIKRFDSTLALPEYKTAGAAAMDLVAREAVVIPKQAIGYVPLNFALKLPKDYFALVAARSSLHKKGLMFANSIGIGDEDFSGNEDEYKAILFNFTQEEVVIERGERIAQLIILKRKRVTLIETEQLDKENRGGIGSTGFK